MNIHDVSLTYIQIYIYIYTYPLKSSTEPGMNQRRSFIPKLLRWKLTVSRYCFSLNLNQACKMSWTFALWEQQVTLTCFDMDFLSICASISPTKAWDSPSEGTDAWMVIFCLVIGWDEQIHPKLPKQFPQISLLLIPSSPDNSPNETYPDTKINRSSTVSRVEDSGGMSAWRKDWEGFYSCIPSGKLT